MFVCLVRYSQLEVEAKLRSLTETNGRLKSQVSSVYLTYILLILRT